MAPPRKSILYQELKAAREAGADIPLDEKTYVRWTEAELDDMVARYLNRPVPASEPVSAPVSPEPPRSVFAQERPAPQQGEPRLDDLAGLAPAQIAARLSVPLSDRGMEQAGVVLAGQHPDDPIRVDSQGRIWFQDEVMKSAIPRPRARKVTRIKGTGARKIEVRGENGRLEESFEVADDRVRDIEIKTTLPSWQVGIYRDLRMPFKIHVYNGIRGFDRIEIVRYFGGIDLVPSSLKSLYVGGDLCYDIRSTRDTIERLYNERVLGRNPSHV